MVQTQRNQRTVGIVDWKKGWEMIIWLSFDISFFLNPRINYWTNHFSNFFCVLPKNWHKILKLKQTLKLNGLWFSILSSLCVAVCRCGRGAVEWSVFSHCSQGLKGQFVQNDRNTNFLTYLLWYLFIHNFGEPLSVLPPPCYNGCEQNFVGGDQKKNYSKKDLQGCFVLFPSYSVNNFQTISLLEHKLNDNQKSNLYT